MSTYRDTRESLGLKQKDLARALNVPAVTVNRWETGATEPRGLHEEVLRGLVESSAGMPPERQKILGTLLKGGLTGFIREAGRVLAMNAEIEGFQALEQADPVIKKSE